MIGRAYNPASRVIGDGVPAKCAYGRIAMASNEDQIRSVVQRFSEAWNRNNGAEVGAFFTEDGCLINPFGERANGRAVDARPHIVATRPA